MDVTCDRCGTEYEFEEALVSTRGTTVKCTQCGHLFKVFRPVARSKPRTSWRVRRSSGSLERLGSLSELTRLIEEGAFTRDDELSRTGKAWKLLGEIEELHAFFERAEAGNVRPRRASSSATLPKLERSPEAEPKPSAAQTPSSPPPSAAVPLIAVSTQGLYDSRRRSSRAPALRRRDSPVPPRSLAAPSGKRPEPAAPPVEVPAQPEEDDLGLGDSDPTAIHPGRFVARAEPIPNAYDSFARRRAPIWLWVFVVLASAGAFGFWLLWPALEPHGREPVSQGADPAVQFLARAEVAFATHRVARFEEALTDYVKALAFHETDPHVLSSISRVYGVWAQELQYQADARARELGESQDVQQRSMQLALTKEVRQLADQAKRYAEQAARKNPGNEEAEVALADALRLTGNLVAARSELDRANVNVDAASAETLRVAALLAIAEAQGNLRAGLSFALQAVAREPELIRTRLLLARCLFADGDQDGAHQQLQSVMTRDRGHPGVQAVEQAQRAAGEASPTTPPTEAAAPASQAPSPPPADDSDGKGGNLSHESYITRGQKALESGQVTNAKRNFEQALFIRPSSPEAHAGLGFVALEKGRVKLAIEHFLEAKREGSSEALIGLGDAYRRMNRPKDALRAYTSYLNEHPQGLQISIARAQIERLGDDAGAVKK